MNNKLAVLLSIALLALSGCNAANTPPAPSASSQPESGIASQPPEPETDEPVENPEEEEETMEAYDPLEGLSPDEYEDLEISAVVLSRMAILPGSAVPITVTVKNNGEKTIAYPHGSSSVETPDALVVRFDGLQPVLPRDRVGGIMTMDYVTKELGPGESLEFTVTAMAIEPDERFIEYTYDLGNSEDVYIADLEFADLLERYPGLVPVEIGSYTGWVNFLYSVPEEDGGELPLPTGPSGYSQAEFQIGVTD